MSILIGTRGTDRFYPGHTSLGILQLLTGGILYICWNFVIIIIAAGKLKTAAGEERG